MSLREKNNKINNKLEEIKKLTGNILKLTVCTVWEDNKCWNKNEQDWNYYEDENDITFDNFMSENSAYDKWIERADVGKKFKIKRYCFNLIKMGVD